MGAAVCVGPISYKGLDAVQGDIRNFTAALQGVQVEEAFIPAVAPGTMELQRKNEYYPTEEAYLFAIAEAMKTEYKAIVEAGFILQIDDPRLVTQYDTEDPEPRLEDYRKFAALRVEALNHALAGLPEERIRYHVCWGSWHGPHTTDVALQDIVDMVLSIRAGGYSLEAANGRHAHEWAVWETVKLPDGQGVDSGRGGAHDEPGGAPGAGGAAAGAVCQAGRARERHCRDGLRLCPGGLSGPRPPEHHVGEIADVGGRSAAGYQGTVGPLG